MAHGLPDDYDVESDANVFKSLDVADLAVRLGALPSFDRRGDVIYWNDFRAGAGILTLIESVGGTDLEFDNTSALSSGVSVAMTTAMIEDEYSMARGTILLGQAKTIGLEALFTLAGGIKSVSLLLQIIEGGICYWFWIDVVIATGEVLYYNPGGIWVSLGTHPYTAPQTTWLQDLKLVINRQDKQHARLVFNNMTFLATGIAPYQFATATNDQLMFELRMRAAALHSNMAYLAGLILTQNEPL